MAVPTLQAQGTIAAVNNGDLTVTLPTYAAYDIVVVNTVLWAPNTNTALGVGTQQWPAGWNYFYDSSIGSQINESSMSIIYGVYSIVWARATSASSLGTTVTVTRGTNVDTGPDTCWAGRAYVIRGCDPNSIPYEQTLVVGTSISTGNPPLPAVTVLGSERLVVAFMGLADNLSAPTAATGYTVGTAATTTTGTDAGFQTYRRSASANVTAVTPTGGVALAQGEAMCYSVAFRPNNPYRVLIT